MLMMHNCRRCLQSVGTCIHHATIVTSQAMRVTSAKCFETHNCIELQEHVKSWSECMLFLFQEIDDEIASQPNMVITECVYCAD